MGKLKLKGQLENWIKVNSQEQYKIINRMLPDHSGKSSVDFYFLEVKDISYQYTAK